MDLFNLMAKLNLDSSGYDKGLRSAERGGKNLASKLEASFTKIQRIIKTSLAAVAVKKLSDSMLSLANATATAGDRIDKQSQKLGLSRQAYQEWDYILRQNGADIDSMAISMKTMTEAITGGSNEAKKAFSDLGVDMKLLKSLTPEQQFDYLIHQFQQMPDGANKSAAALEIFGRNGYDLLPLLNSSSDSVWALKDQMAQLGLYMSDDAIDAAVAYGDSVDTLKATFNAFKYAIGSEILPVLTDAVDTITKYIGKLKKAFDENGIAGVWETLVNDIKHIKWPTWEDVMTAATTAWNTIVEGVAGLGGLIFGRDTEGNVKWPTLHDMMIAAEDLWGHLLDMVGSLGGLIFGRDTEGNVKWPSWEEIKQTASDAWDDLVGYVAGLPQLVFGEGTAIGDGLTTALNLVKNVGDWAIEHGEQVAMAIGGIFGAFQISKFAGLIAAHPAIAAITALITAAVANQTGIESIQHIATAVEAIGAAFITYKLVEKIGELKTVLSGVFSGTGLTGINKWELILSGIAALSVLIYEHWDDIAALFETIGTFVNDNIIAPIKEWFNGAIADVKQFFQPVTDFITSIAESIQDIINWVLDFLGLNETPDTVHNGVDLDNVKAEHRKRKEMEAIAAMDADDYAREFHVDKEEATKAIEEVKKKLEEIPEEVDVKIKVQATAPGAGSFSSGGSFGNYVTPFDEYKGRYHASGLWTVPYDNYVARLHRGERVLTASQTRHDGGADTDTIVQAVTTAISQSMKALMGSLKIELNNKQVGKVVGDSVSTRVNNNIGSIQDKIAYGYGR